MARYKLHCFCQSGNSYKVALYLNCAGLDWEPVFVDFFKGATRDSKWRASVNEMGEAPVLETQGKKLSQSGVILLHLAQTTGKFAACKINLLKGAACRWRGRTAGDELMTPRTSEVAVCCSRDWVSSRVVACTSSKSRVFSMAMTAWSAKVFKSSNSVRVSTRKLASRLDRGSSIRKTCGWRTIARPRGDALALPP